MAGRKVFVGSLPNSITEEVLKAEFSRYGQVQEVYIKPNCEPGRQWGFVTFSTPEQAQFVKETCDRVLTIPGHDRPCDVMLAKNQGSFVRDGGGSDPHAYAYQHAASNGYAVVPAAYQPGATGSIPTATGNYARKIFVGSLPDDTPDSVLRTEFSKYGVVEDIFLKPNCESGRQWAFVTFASPDQAVQAAQTTNGILQFAGSIKPCEVTLARNQGMFGQDPILAGAPPAAEVPVAAPACVSPMTEAQVSPKKIFVGSLPDSITDPMLRAEFSKYGQITDLFMKTNCEPGRQWSFITFATSEQAQFARNSCDKVLIFPGSERPCEVTMARHQGMFGKESIEGQPGVAMPHGTFAAPAPVVAVPVAIEGPRKIFVGSLPDSITDAVLRAEYSKYGQIVDLFLKTTCEPGRQWAFLTFASHDQAAYAKDATDRKLMLPGADRACEVMLAKNQGKFGQAPLASFSAAAAAMPMVAIPEPAQPPPPATPPPAHLTPWRMYRTASGLPYYHNASTGVTQWEPPPDFQIPGQPAAYAMPVQAAYGGAAVAGQRYAPY